MTKIAVVGTGKIAKEILPVLDLMDEIKVVAICGTKRSADVVASLKEQYHIDRSYTDFDEMLASEESGASIDFIYLAVPNHLHYPMAKQALIAGYHVFLEKPFTLKSAQAKELIDFARSNNLFLAEAISNQYLPIYEDLRNALPKIGQLKYVEMNFSQYSSRFDRFLEGEYFPVFDPKIGGGALMDINVYNLHVAVGLFGEPKEAVYKKNIMREVDTSGVATLKYDDFICNCIGAKDCQGPNQVLLQGTKGYLRILAPSNTMMAALEFQPLNQVQPEVIYSSDTSIHRMTYEFAAFAKMISSKNYEECRKRQEETLQVSKLLERLI